MVSSTLLRWSKRRRVERAVDAEGTEEMTIACKYLVISQGKTQPRTYTGVEADNIKKHI